MTQPVERLIQLAQMFNNDSTQGISHHWEMIQVMILQWYSLGLRQLHPSLFRPTLPHEVAGKKPVVHNCRWTTRISSINGASLLLGVDSWNCTCLFWGGKRTCLCAAKFCLSPLCSESWRMVLGYNMAWDSSWILAPKITAPLDR